MGGGEQSTANEPTRLGGVQIQQSALGARIKAVWGTAKIAGNLIWAGDFESIREENKLGGGKGAGGSSGSVSYRYKSSVMIGLAQGVISEVTTVIENKNKTKLSDLGMTLFSGAKAQALWGYLEAKHPEQALGYSMLAYVAAAGLEMGQSATIPNYQFIVRGRGRIGSDPGSGRVIEGAAIETIINELISNEVVGAGLDQSMIGDMSQLAAYSRAIGLFPSYALSDSTSAHDALNALLDAANTEALWSDDVIKMICLADQPVIGNGASYQPNITPVATITDDDLKDQKDPIQIERKDAGSQPNCIKVEYASAATDYNASIVEAKDAASISQFGARYGDIVKYDFIDNAETAGKVADVKVRKSIYNLGTYRFTLSASYDYLEPGDIVVLTSTIAGIDGQALRILSTSERDIAIEIEAEELSIGVSTPAMVSTTEPSPFSLDKNQAAGPVLDHVIYEPPPSLAGGPEVWIGAYGGQHWGGAEAWVSLDGATYEKIGDLNGKSRLGVTASRIAGDVQIVAHGGNYNLQNHASFTKIEVNNLSIALSLSRGHIAAVIDGNGVLQSVNGFDDYVTNQDGPITALLNTIAVGHVLVFVSYDACSLTGAIRAKLVEFGGSSSGQTWADSRVSHAFVGKKGSTQGHAAESIETAKEASVTFTYTGIQSATYVDVNISGSGGELLPVTAAQRDADSSLCLIGGEIFGYSQSTLTGPGLYRLNGLRRGAHGTSAFTRPAGEKFWRLYEPALLRYGYSPEALLGKQIFVKLRSFNIYGGGLQSLADVQPVAYTVKGAALGAVAGLSAATPWVGRDLVVKWDEYSGAEKYLVKISSGATIKRTVTVSDTRFVYTYEQNKADALGPKRALTISVRALSANGQSSLESLLNVVNPQMQPPTLTVGSVSQGVIIDAGAATESDYAGLKIWLSQQQGFDVNSVTAYYNGADRIAPSGKLAAGAWYVKSAQYDVFGTDELAYTSEIAVQVVQDAGAIVRLPNATSITATAGSPPPGGDPAWSVYSNHDGKMYRWSQTLGAYTKAADGGDLIAGSVTADKVFVNALSAITANLGEITSAVISLAASLTSGGFSALRSGTKWIADGADGWILARTQSTTFLEFKAGRTLLRLGNAFANKLAFGKADENFDRVAITDDGITMRNASGNITISNDAGAIWSYISGTGKPEDNATLGATNANLKAGVGTNLLTNSEMRNTLSYYGWSNYSAVHFAVTTGSWRAANLQTMQITIPGTVPAGYVIDLGNNNTNKSYPVAPGKRYEIGASISTHRLSTAYVAITFRDKNNGYISEHNGNNIAPLGVGENTAWEHWGRSNLIVAAPDAAAFATIYVRGLTGTEARSDPFIFMCGMYFGEAGVSQTEFTKYSPGAPSFMDGNLIEDQTIIPGKLLVGSISEISPNAGIITSGKLQNSAGRNWLDLNATGSSALIRATDASGVEKVRINADGTTKFNNLLTEQTVSGSWTIAQPIVTQGDSGTTTAAIGTANIPVAAGHAWADGWRILDAVDTGINIPMGELSTLAIEVLPVATTSYGGVSEAGRYQGRVFMEAEVFTYSGFYKVGGPPYYDAPSGNVPDGHVRVYISPKFAFMSRGQFVVTQITLTSYKYRLWKLT